MPSVYKVAVSLLDWTGWTCSPLLQKIEGQTATSIIHCSYDAFSCVDVVGPVSSWSAFSPYPSNMMTKDCTKLESGSKPADIF